MCTDQQPWYDAATKMSYGFAAGVVKNVPESGSCCACYELHFKGVPRMVVQVGNTGADLKGDGHFDIQVPGGGFGIFDACTDQWDLKSKTAWGARYGGVMAAGWKKEKGCSTLTKDYRKSCEWHYDYLGDNPIIEKFYRVVCPDAIVQKSGCKREDDAEQGSGPPAPGPGGSGGGDDKNRRRGGKGGKGSKGRRRRGGKGGGRRRRRKN
jgi:hypothetical protein